METQELINLFKGLNTNFVYYDGSEESIKALEKLFHAYYSNKDDSGKLLYLTHSQPHSYDNCTTLIEVGYFAFQGYSDDWNFGRMVFSYKELNNLAKRVKYNKDINRYEICFLKNSQNSITDELKDLLNIIGIEVAYYNSKNELDIAYYRTNMWNIDKPTNEFYNTYKTSSLHEGDIITIDNVTKEYSVIYKDGFEYYCRFHNNSDAANSYCSYVAINLEYKGLLFKFRLKKNEEGKTIFRGYRLNNFYKNSAKTLNFEANIEEYIQNPQNYIKLFLKEFCKKVDNNEVDIEYYDDIQFELNL